MDCVSSLPNDLLCHILSFLTTKDAALTSVLSKRWRNLLAFVPYLDIDDYVFLYPEKDKPDRPEIIQSFMEFVDRVLALQGDALIKKFSLSCMTAVDSVRVDDWISKVLARGVSDMDLSIILDIEDPEENYLLSPKSFESKTLVNLKLDCGIEIGWSAGSISLPMLKTLVLVSPRVHKFEIFLHALPALEELDLVDVLWEDSDVIISSASLKTLTIKKNRCLETLSFDTPNLVYFKHTGFVAPNYPVVNMKNLVDAQIIFYLTEEQLQRLREPDNDHWFDQGVAIGYSNVWKLFHGIQNVSNLYLSPDTLEVLSRCCESMPIFVNLKCLAIKSDKEHGWEAMPVLLKKCPRLETLVLEGLLHYVTDKCGMLVPAFLGRTEAVHSHLVQ